MQGRPPVAGGDRTLPAVALEQRVATYGIEGLVAPGGQKRVQKKLETLRRIRRLTQDDAARGRRLIPQTGQRIRQPERDSAL
jgi:hypothetical protein